jgi:hypothetical protein
MVVRIRFGRGQLVTRRKGKNSRSALIAASFLTLIAVCFAALGMWRVSEDVDLGGSFIFPEGLFSHWQVWIAAAVLTQYGAWRLTQYARLARARRVSPDGTTDGTTDETADETTETATQSGMPAKV